MKRQQIATVCLTVSGFDPDPIRPGFQLAWYRRSWPNLRVLCWLVPLIATAGSLTACSGDKAGEPSSSSSSGSYSESSPASSSSLSSSKSSSSSTASSSTSSAPFVATSPVNDTGVEYCRDYAGQPQDCDEALPQDGTSGRDALAALSLLGKIGGGAAAFDFTKLDGHGQPLAVQNEEWQEEGSEDAGTRWHCVRDNHTGLTWEVKSSNPASLRYNGFSYTWYNQNASANGGFAGEPGASGCGGIDCNTEAYLAAINESTVCGSSQWRLPTVNELLSLVYANRKDLAIDANYFPNTQPSHYWSSQGFAPSSTHAWYVYFSDGSPSNTLKSTPMFLRLVHGGGVERDVDE